MAPDEFSQDRRHRDEMFGDKVNLAGGLQWYKSHMLGYDVLSTLTVLMSRILTDASKALCRTTRV